MASKIHIITVHVDGYWISYNVEVVNNNLTILARFVKDGKERFCVHSINDGMDSGAGMIKKLLDRDYAIKMAKEMLER